MIPKIFFTYWEGNRLSKLHYYTIYSLVKFNPDVPIIIYTSKIEYNVMVQWTSGEQESSDFEYIALSDILSISNNIQLIQIDFENEYNIKSNISCIFKADFVRICKLYEHGGMWFDFDILFIKQIPDWLFETNHNILYFRYQDTIPTGLLFASSKNDTIKNIYIHSIQTIVQINNQTITDYQILGPNIWNLYYPYYVNSFCLETELVYPYLWDNITLFFKSYVNMIRENTFGIHWYNGGIDSSEYIQTFNPNELNSDKCVIDKYLLQICNL